jgi:hypothetical protein
MSDVNNAVVCPWTVEMLLAGKVAATASCPNCREKVIAHVVKGATDNRRFDHSKVLPMLKGIRWLKNPGTAQTSQEFFSSIELRLTAYHEFRDSEWVKFLPGLMEDQHDGRWVNEKILIPKLTWDLAKSAFSLQFDRSILRDDLRRQYHRCRQQPSEHIQEFLRRFRDLCSQLDYDKSTDQEIRSVEELLDRIQPTLKADYFLFSRGIMSTGSDEARGSLQTLEGVSRHLIEISKNRPPLGHAAPPSSHQPPSASGNNGNRHRDRDRKRGAPPAGPQQRSGGQQNRVARTCPEHPNGSHSWDVCSKNPANSGSAERVRPASTQERKPGPAPPASVLTCYACGQAGHKSSDPKCPLFAKRSGAGASAAPKPSFSSQNSAQPRSSAPSYRSTPAAALSTDPGDGQEESDHNDDQFIPARKR